MEATMYALLAGCANLGNTISANCGALLLEYLGCTPNGSVGETKKFDNLWLASAIGIFLPVVPIVALFKLVPDARQNEAFADPKMTATSGSLWEHWSNKEYE